MPDASVARPDCHIYSDSYHALCAGHCRWHRHQSVHPYRIIDRYRTASVALRRRLHRGERRPASWRLRHARSGRLPCRHHMGQRHAVRVRAGSRRNANGQLQHQYRRWRGRSWHVSIRLPPHPAAPERGTLPGYLRQLRLRDRSFQFHCGPHWLS